MRSVMLTAIVIVLVLMVWADESSALSTINSLLQAAENLALVDTILSTEGGLRDITKVAISVYSSDKDNLFTKQDLENQLLVGLRSKLPKLEVVLLEEELAANRYSGNYEVELRVLNIVDKTESGYKRGYVAHIDLSVVRHSRVPGPTSESSPVIAEAILWQADPMLLKAPPETAKSYIKEVIDDTITDLAAAYYKQNSEEKPKPVSTLGREPKYQYQLFWALWEEFKSYTYYLTILTHAIGWKADEDGSWFVDNLDTVEELRLIGEISKGNINLLESIAESLGEIAKEDPDEAVRKAAAEALKGIRIEKLEGKETIGALPTTPLPKPIYPNRKASKETFEEILKAAGIKPESALSPEAEEIHARTPAPTMPAAAKESHSYYICNSNMSASRKFHRPDCEWAKKISPANRLVFKSRQDVINQGYQACKVCKP